MRSLNITQQVTGKDTKSLENYLKEVAKISLFKNDEEEIICGRKAFKGDKKAIEEMVTRNLRFVITVSKQYTNRGANLSDLINEGNIGLITAAKRYNPDTGFKFISYAVWYIRKEILEHLSGSIRQIKVPINRITGVMKFNNKLNDLTHELGREPYIEDFIGHKDFTEFSDSDIKIMLHVKTSNITSLDASFDEENSNTLSDVISDDTFGPTDRLVNKELSKDAILSLLNVLSDRDKSIIMMSFGLGMSHSFNLTEISDKLGLTKEGVRQIKLKSIAKIQNRAKKLNISVDMF